MGPPAGLGMVVVQGAKCTAVLSPMYDTQQQLPVYSNLYFSTHSLMHCLVCCMEQCYPVWWDRGWVEKRWFGQSSHSSGDSFLPLPFPNYENIQEKLIQKSCHGSWLNVHAWESNFKYESVGAILVFHSNILSSSSCWAFTNFDLMPGRRRGGCHCHPRVEGRHRGQFRHLLGDRRLNETFFSN